MEMSISKFAAFEMVRHDLAAEHAFIGKSKSHEGKETTEYKAPMDKGKRAFFSLLITQTPYALPRSTTDARWICNPFQAFSRSGSLIAGAHQAHILMLEKSPRGLLSATKSCRPVNPFIISLNASSNTHRLNCGQRTIYSCHRADIHGTALEKMGDRRATLRISGFDFAGITRHVVSHLPYGCAIPPCSFWGRYSGDDAFACGGQHSQRYQRF